MNYSGTFMSLLLGLILVPLMLDGLGGEAYGVWVAAAAVGSEVPARGDVLALEQSLGQQQVARQGVEDVLPGADVFRVAHGQRPPPRGGPHQVGNQAVLGPVAAADHISGARGGDR